MWKCACENWRKTTPIPLAATSVRSRNYLYSDMQRPHEVLHVELVGAAWAGAFLLCEPDFFFGDVGEHDQSRNGATILLVRRIHAVNRRTVDERSPVILSRIIDWYLLRALG